METQFIEKTLDDDQVHGGPSRDGRLGRRRTVCSRHRSVEAPSPMDEPLMRWILHQVDRVGCSPRWVGADLCVAVNPIPAGHNGRPYPEMQAKGHDLMVSDGHRRFVARPEHVIGALKRLPDGAGLRRFWRALEDEVKRALKELGLFA